MMNGLSQKAISQIIRYDCDTGKLYWVARELPIHSARAQHLCRLWNRRYAGKEAFTSVNSTGYKHGSLLGKSLKAHQVIWILVHDEWPAEIDHINGIPTDNRLANLRLVTHGQNMKNRKLQRNNTSGVSGVAWRSKIGKWVAQVKSGSKVKYLGSFSELRDAIAARAAANEAYDFHPNHGRD